MVTGNKNILKKRRLGRVRTKMRGTAKIPRLSLHVSNKHYYVQAINDEKGVTVASSGEKKIHGVEKMLKREKAQAIGRDIARQLREEKKIKKVVFDRGSRRYAGNVKLLADAAREAGLVF